MNSVYRVICNNCGQNYTQVRDSNNSPYCCGACGSANCRVYLEEPSTGCAACDIDFNEVCQCGRYDNE